MVDNNIHIKDKKDSADYDRQKRSQSKSPPLKIKSSDKISRLSGATSKDSKLSAADLSIEELSLNESTHSGKIVRSISTDNLFDLFEAKFISPKQSGIEGEVTLGNYIGKDSAYKYAALKRCFSEAKQKQEITNAGILRKENLHDHPHIGRIIGTLENNDLVMEEYKTPLPKNERWFYNGSIEKAVPYALGIIKGISAMLEKNIRHNDLHMNNIMIDDNDKTRIIDFGLLSQLFNDDEMMTGLVDYKNCYNFARAENEQSIAHKDFVHNAFYDTETMPAIRNNPLLTIRNILSVKCADPKILEAIRACSAAMREEKYLFKAHIFMDFMKENEDIKTLNMVTKNMPEFKSFHAAYNQGGLEAIERIAMEKASSIKEQFYSIIDKMNDVQNIAT